MTDFKQYERLDAEERLFAEANGLLDGRYTVTGIRALFFWSDQHSPEGKRYRAFKESRRVEQRSQPLETDFSQLPASAELDPSFPAFKELLRDRCIGGEALHDAWYYFGEGWGARESRPPGLRQLESTVGRFAKWVHAKVNRK